MDTTTLDMADCVSHDQAVLEGSNGDFAPYRPASFETPALGHEAAQATGAGDESRALLDNVLQSDVGSHKRKSACDNILISIS